MEIPAMFTGFPSGMQGALRHAFPVHVRTESNG
jgi:hypothetical protein